MADDKFHKLMIMGVLFAVFTFFMGMFAIALGGNYGKDTSELEGGKFDLSGLNKTLKKIDEKGKAYQDQFTKQSFLSTAGFIVVNGIFDLTSTMFDFMIEPFKIFSNMVVNTFAPSDNQDTINIISNVITFLLIISMIFGVWSLIKRGN